MIKKSLGSISMGIIVVLFVGCLVAIYFTYDGVKLDTLLIVLGSLFGITLGSYFAGRNALLSVREQVKYDEKKAEQNEVIKQDKYNTYLSIHLNIIFNEARGVIYFMRIQGSPLNPLNIDPLEELEGSLTRIKETMQQLFTIDPSYISIENFKLLGKINDKTYEIERNYKGFLATEDEEQKYHFQQVISQSEKLLEVSKNK